MAAELTIEMPASVAAGRACSLCWRHFGSGTFFVLELDGVSRRLCKGCTTLLYPAMPPGLEGAAPIHMSVDSQGLVRRSCVDCGGPVDAPPNEPALQCMACFLLAREATDADR